MLENLKNNNLSETFASIFSGDAKIEDKKNKVEPAKTKETAEVKLEESKEPQKDEVKKEEPNLDLKAEYETLKKRFDESRSWGHKKNSAHINAKKNVMEFLGRLQEDAVIAEDDVKVVLSYFDASEETAELDIESKSPENPYVKVKENLNKEFSVFKKYSKIEDAEEKYQAFFSFLPLFPKDEQEKIINYMMNESPDVIIDNIMLLGGDVYDNLHKGAEKVGGIMPFVKSLHSKIEILEKRNKELEAELDTTQGIVHNRSINSKVSNLASTQSNKKSFADIWQH